jgi:hypothetical protein
MAKNLVDVELRLPKGHAKFIADLAKIGGISQSDVVSVILALTIYREKLYATAKPDPQP